jgi:hypothetical protein
LSLWKIDSPARTSPERSAWLSALSTSVVVARGIGGPADERLANASRTLASHSTPSSVTSRGQIGHPQSVRRGGPEVALDQVRRGPWW